MGSAQAIFLPHMMGMQREMVREMNESAERDGEHPIPEFPEDLLDYPSWFESWSIINGSVGVVLSAGCLLAGVLLLIVRSGAARLFLLFSGLSVVWHVVRIAIGAQGATLVAWSIIPGAIAGLALHTVLIAVVLMSDRDAYESRAA
jgi:hypothetical protein